MRACCVCLLLLAAAPALADDEAAPGGEHWRRELGGHVFIPSLAIDDPFLSTNLAVYTGAGYSWIDGPDFDTRGNLLTNQRSYVAEALAEAVTFQAGITRWLALRVGGGGGINAGSDGRSALVVGATQPITVDAGVTASWRLARIVRLGGTFDFAYSHLKLIQPLSAVQASIAGAQVDAAQASQRVDGYAIAPGAAVAIAPHPAIGLLAVAQYQWNGYYGDIAGVGLSSFVLGASAQLDLRPFVPWLGLGFLVAYRAQLPFESGTRYTHTLEGGIFYTGRRAIDLGIDLQVKWFDLRPYARFPLDTTQLISVVLLRYHWN